MFRHLFLLVSVLLCRIALLQAQEVQQAQPHLLSHECPNGAIYLPAPPSLDDVRFVNDWLQYRWGMAQRSTDRCQLALEDGDRDCGKVLRRFAPAIGFTLTRQNAPLTYAFFDRLRYDASSATRAAKDAYARRRPYQQFGEHTPCPQYEDTLRTSYPSAHNAQGWLYAMALAYFDPACQDQIFRIGYDYGVSRIILGFHYQSDTDAGRLAASATFARLLAEPGFLEEMQAAKAEYLAVKERYMNRPIVILYDNDVHCGIDGYSQLAGLRDAIQASDTAFVAVVSSGDFIQGGTAGTLSRGQYIIDIVNAVGYDAMTIGNHEFDYGTPRLLELTSQLSAPVTCVNFSQMSDGSQFYAPFVMRQFGARCVAFVGVLTPSTLVSEASAFYDADGRQLYDLHHDQVYQLVQQAVDSARHAGADYVVVLSHLGEANSDIVSGGLIANTTGIDVVLDGHSHSVIPCDTVLNREGRPVLTTQTGTKLQNIGKLLIASSGTVSLSLLPTASVSERSASVAAVVDSIQQVNAELTNLVCGRNLQLLTINDAEGHRLVRKGETNLANFCADAYRWYAGSQLAFLNGGGVRTDLPQGDVSYGRLMDVHPFENILCVVNVTGSQLCSVLDLASADYPAESGMFIQPSGFRYTITPDATPRVSDVEVLNAEGQYEPIDPDGQYTLTTIAYLLTQYGGLLRDCEVVKLNICNDVEALYNYVTDSLGGNIGSQYAQPQGRIIIR